jgi:Tol biopolymer transport system component
MSASAAAPRDLFVVHPDGTERTDITSSDSSKLSWAPVWSPDSTKLLFVRFGADGEDPNLWTVNVDGSALAQVTHSPGEYTGYRWLPDPLP